ncbi:MAG TPA: DinB family protein [Thermomicrobiaceae bacterium]|nr:DinB family protein [Thermomicrobiaceae bacterium]
MMAHPLADQLRFARSEFRRGLEGLSEEDATRRLMPMNSISWMIGHLAWHEQRLWLVQAQGITPVPAVDAFGYGKPASTPPLVEVWHDWQAVVEASEPYLDSLVTGQLEDFWERDGRRFPESIGTSLRRVTYHYWYHTGESQAVRQLLGNTGLVDFVGDIGDEAPYRPE